MTWTYVPDDNTRELQVKGGQAQIDQYPAWSTVSALKSTPGVTLSLFPSTETTYLGFNENVKPFQDVHVRRAISYAIDRSALVKAVLFGNGQAANSIFPPQVPYYDASSGGLQFDTAQAKAELAKSSVPHGFTTTLQVPSGNSDSSTNATIIQSELKPLGINVQIQQIDANTAHNNVQAEKYEMAFSLWTMDIPDPDELATFALDPNAGSKSFFTNYNNPAVVKAVHAAELTTAPAARQTDYNTAQTRVGAGRLPRVPVLLAVPVRRDVERARIQRHAARQLPHGGRLAQLKLTRLPAASPVETAGPGADQRPAPACADPEPPSEVFMGRMTFVFQRLALLVPTAIGVTIITFFMVHLIPGDPAVTVLGEHATPQAVALLHHEWGLDKPLAEQYWLFIDRLLHGNLGESLYYTVPVWGLITGRLPATLWLLCYAAVIAIVISVPLSVLAASRKDAHPRPRRAGRAAARPGHAGLLVRPDPADLAGHQAPAVPGHRLRRRDSSATCTRCSCPA